jgi:hypothetical protein
LYRCIDIIIFPILDSNTHKTVFDKKKQQNGYIFFKSSTGEFPVFSGPVEFLNRSGPAGPVPALIQVASANYQLSSLPKKGKNFEFHRKMDRKNVIYLFKANIIRIGS